MTKHSLLQELSQEHNLSDIEHIRLRSEYELTELKFEYALYNARKSGLPLYDSLVKYSAIKRYTKQLSREKYGELADRLRRVGVKDVDESLQRELTENLFLQFNKTQKILRHAKADTCFDYDVYEEEGASIHFKNAIVPKHPLRGDEIEDRKKELKYIASDIDKNHPEVKYVFSVSWMWNMKGFQDLMPQEFCSSLREFTEHEYYSDGHWGQFYRYDGTLNYALIQEFKKS